MGKGSGVLIPHKPSQNTPNPSSPYIPPERSVRG